MLICEGYKMFHGTMMITPKNNIDPFSVEGTWLYKPEYDTWYCKGASYPNDICKIISDNTHSKDDK